MITVLLLASTLWTTQAEPISRIAMASCFNQDQPMPLWDAVNALKPEAFLFLGDNVYADRRESDGTWTTLDFDEEYAKMNADSGYAALKKQTPTILGVWDDHDFGRNDAGVEFEKKKEAKAAFNRFFGIAETSERAKRDGNYDSVILGPEGKRIQFIMLDTRSFRSSLKRAEGENARGYVPDDSADKTVLGDAQWAWLEKTLQEPAEVRLLISSIQVASEEHIFEKWANFPREREKLFGVLNKTKAAGVIILSGDRHLGDLSVMDVGLGYPLYDLTASAFNRSSLDFRMPEPNRHRVAGMVYGNNFGYLTIDWNMDDPEIKLQLRDGEEPVVQQKIRLNWLQPGKIRPRIRN